MSTRNGMTFEENEGYLTNELAGRTIRWIERHGKEIHIYTTCDHKVILQADVNGDIRYKGTGVQIMLEGQEFNIHQGL